MTTDCAKCSVAITGFDSVVCRGYCGATFHMNCSGVSRALMSYFTSHKKNLFWMCDKCAELFENSHFRTISLPTVDNEPLTSLTNAISKLRTEIQQMSAKSEATSTIAWPSVNQRSAVKRKRDEVGDGRSTEACKSGSKQSAENIIAVPSPNVQLDKKFWLYLSRIRPDVPEDVVTAMVKENLETNKEPAVVKLVPKGKDIKTLSFVSFKIGIDDDLKDKALDPATWPEGLMFREFEDYGARKLLVPSKFARLVTPNPQTFPTDTSAIHST